MLATVARRRASTFVNPSALSPAELARLLASASKRAITVDHVHADINDGAPTNPDGTINLVHYVAWLLSVRGR